MDHWDQGSAAVAGAPAAAFFDALDAEVRWSNGGFRQPSRIKRAELGKIGVFCDTHPQAVCVISWTGAPSGGARVEITTADLGGRAPCRSEFALSDGGLTVACGAQGLSDSRLPAPAAPSGLAPARPEGISVFWREERTVDGIEIRLTRAAIRAKNEFPLESFQFRLPGAELVAVAVGPGAPGPSQMTGNRLLGDGNGDAAWMESFGYGDDGRLYSILVSWSYFILSGNPDDRNVYVKRLREVAGGREFVSLGGRERAIRMKAFGTAQ